MKVKSVGCGNWSQGWGFGDKNKVGRLTADPATGQWIWKGRSQGRHGQVWNRGAWVKFTMIDNPIDSAPFDYTVGEILDSKGDYPYQRDLAQGVCDWLRENKLTWEQFKAASGDGPLVF